MLARRIIARLDVKPPNLVKGIRQEGLRRIGDPAVYARKYADEGIDEIAYQDVWASWSGGCGILPLVSQTADEVFVPLSVGGGIRSLDDAIAALHAGADKIVVCSEALRRPALIRELSEPIGRANVVVEIQSRGGMACMDHGREVTDIDSTAWAKRAEELGAGELVLSDVERDGVRGGMNCDWIAQVVSEVSVPVVAHCGAGLVQHVASAFRAGASGVMLGSILHGIPGISEPTPLDEIRDEARECGFLVR
jgi:imidazole glycerol-phosphate synthase subunit HisF